MSHIHFSAVKARIALEGPMKMSRLSVVWMAAAAPVAGLLMSASSASAAQLVARYEFEDPSNLGLDLAGGDDNATNIGGVTQTTGRPGVPGSFAAAFDGSDDVLRRDGGLVGYDGLPGVTYTAWVNNITDGGYNGIISQDAGGCCTYRVLLDPSSNLYVNTGAHQDVGNAGNVPPGQWHHVAMTVQDNGDGSRTAFTYVDGVQIGGPFTQTPGLPDASLFNTYLGAGEGGTAHLFQGALDDVRVYDGALSSSEVLAVFQDNTVPEPTAVVLGLASFGLLGLRRRR